MKLENHSRLKPNRESLLAVIHTYPGTLVKRTYKNEEGWDGPASVILFTFIVPMEGKNKKVYWEREDIMIWAHDKGDAEIETELANKFEKTMEKRFSDIDIVHVFTGKNTDFVEAGEYGMQEFDRNTRKNKSRIL